MKIYIFGVKGMLGNYMKTYLSKKYKVISFERKDYNLENLSYNSLLYLLESKGINKNDLVINCIGVIPHKNDSNKNRLYYKINSVFPVILGEIIRNKDAKFINITTDCVFSGRNRKEIYNESSLHDETNDYGISKSLGELSFGTIIRTSIIGEELLCKKSLLEWVKSNDGKTINGYSSHYWNGVTCLQLSKIIEEIIDRNLFWEGVRHIFSPEIVSKFDLVKKIIAIYQLNINVEKMETEIIDKSMSSIYEPLFKIPNLDEQIREMRDFGKLIF